MLTSVPITPGSSFNAGSPQKILTSTYYRGASALGLDLRAYDVSADGRRFVMIKDPEASPEGPPVVNMVVVLHWSEELKQRLPSR